MADLNALGVLGGMFDPVHFGHLRTMLEVKRELALPELRLVPCAIPPHRASARVDARRRVEMLHLAIQDEPGILVDEREIHRAAPSYTFDTLVSLRDEVGKRPICLIVGMDTFKGLPSWYRWQELMTWCHLVVMSRPGWQVNDQDTLQAFIASHQVHEPGELHKRMAGGLYFCPVTELAISSTHIRDCLMQGDSVRYLLPEEVRAYIARHRLYE